MKVVFIGPTGHQLAIPAAVERRPPAGMGDVASAVLSGATVIGLVDGVFGERPAVWHKEILWALSLGVRVVGAASMGALRAAECAPYGMEGVGVIFDQYLTGDLIDDDAVAVLQAPEDLGSFALSTALVDLVATIEQLRKTGKIDQREANSLLQSARQLHFSERRIEALARQVAPRNPDATAQLLKAQQIHLKAADACQLVAVVAGAADERRPPPQDWNFVKTIAFQRLLDDIGSTRSPAGVA